MFKSYLKIALRNLRKHVGYTLINLVGLAAGIACCLLIVLFVQDERSFDRFHEQADQIYRVRLEGQFSGSELNAPVTPAPMAAALVKDFPEVQTSTRIFPFAGQQLLRRGDQYFIEEGVYFVDSTFFDIFTFPLLRGNPETALKAPNMLVLTESMASKYFGKEDPMGQSLIIGDSTHYEISGIIADVPANSHFQFDFLASMTSLPFSQSEVWISNNFFTYLVLPEHADVAQLEAQLPEFFKKYAGPQINDALGLQFDEFMEAGNVLEYHLQALTDIHLHSNLQFELGTNSDIAYVYIFSAIAFFILLIACINFMNLATARSAGRALEVGMRKVLGSSRKQLIRQFLGESILLSFIALLLAVGLMVLLLPSFNELAGKEISAAFLGNIPVLIGLGGIALAVGLIAGSYPAFFLSAFRPVTVLKGTLQGGMKSSLLRNGLVVFQFAISIGLIAGTMVVSNQLSYVRNKKLGFDKEHVVVIQRAGQLGEQQDAFKQEVRAHSSTVNIAGTTALPGGLFGATAYQPEGAPANETHLMAPVFVDHDFVKTLGMTMASGRAFSEDFPSDSAAFLLNRASVRALGWGETDPIGKKITQFANTPENFFTGEVVGVIEDFHYASLHQEIGSLAIRLSNFPLPFLAVRIRPDDISGTLAFLEETWRTFAPDEPFQYTFLDEDFNAQYQAEERLGNIFTAFALFAILIACLGLFGLASFTAEQRKKEIGVRKALGASIPQIVLLLSKEFTKLVLIAFVVAAPVAYFAMNDWLQDFAYQTSLGVGTFLIAGILALAIAWLTVSYQSVKAAVANPVESLRYE
ncbi:MAG: ABC transporter permease [Rhodothermales bacterium]